MRILTRNPASDGVAWWKSAALAFALVFFVLAAAYSAVPKQYRQATIARLTGQYPVRLDLAEVKALTLAGDRARVRARIAEAKREEELALASFNQLTVEPPAEEEAGKAPEEPESFALHNPVSQLDQPQASFGDAESNGFIELDFDLAGGPDSGGVILVEKDVVNAQGLLGRVQVRIDTNSTIFVSSDDVRMLLPEHEKENPSLAQEFTTIASLRSKGVNLRYDPTQDLFILSQ